MQIPKFHALALTAGHSERSVDKSSSPNQDNVSRSRLFQVLGPVWRVTAGQKFGNYKKRNSSTHEQKEFHAPLQPGWLGSLWTNVSSCAVDSSFVFLQKDVKDGRSSVYASIIFRTFYSRSEDYARI